MKLNGEYPTCDLDAKTLLLNRLLYSIEKVDEKVTNLERHFSGEDEQRLASNTIDLDMLNEIYCNLYDTFLQLDDVSHPKIEAIVEDLKTYVLSPIEDVLFDDNQ